jgi:hypothetical protein
MGDGAGEPAAAGDPAVIAATWAERRAISSAGLDIKE